MANNRTLSTPVASLPSGVVAALYELANFYGDVSLAAPAVLGTITGTEGAHTFNELTSRVAGASRALEIVQLDASGTIVTPSAGTGTSSNFGSALPSSGTAAGFYDGTNMQSARLFDGDTGGGTQYVLGAILRTVGSGGTVEAGTATSPLRTDPIGSTTQPVVSVLQTTATLTNVATSNVSAQLLASNTSRRRARIFNDSSFVMYVKYGTTASSSSFTDALDGQTSIIIDDYSGRIDGILASGTGNARVTEL